MKDEFKKYLESETKLNNQSFHMREFWLKICIGLIVIGLGLVAFAMYMALA